MKKAFETALASSMFILLALGSQAQAGGESSAGGADDYRILPAFFTVYGGTPTPVRTCLAEADGFGVAEAALKPMIQSAFDQWGAYLHAKKMDSQETLPNSERIRTTVTFQECDGTEELKFYFGVEDTLVSQFKSQFTQPFGFAALTSELPSHGIVWIAPPKSIQGPSGLIPVWSQATQDSLAGLVLHEVGHVFGNGHVDDTAMTGQIGLFLAKDTDPTSSTRVVNLYSSIDSVRDLILCLDCDESYAAATQFDIIHHADSDWAYAFQMLVGRAPVGAISIRLDRKAAAPGPFVPPGSGELVISDATETFHLEVDTRGQGAADNDSSPLFEGQGGKSFLSSSVSYPGYVHTSSGTKLEVTINYNMDHVKAEIIPVTDDFFPRPLFVSAE